jgi:hypothetical protein
VDKNPASGKVEGAMKEASRVANAATSKSEVSLPVQSAALPANAAPETGAQLPVFNVQTFERMTDFLSRAAVDVYLKTGGSKRFGRGASACQPPRRRTGGGPARDPSPHGGS